MISQDVKHPGPRPKKPSRPRKPKETFKRTEVIWTSEDDDILLADLLHLIPSVVKAEDIRLSVERNETNGYPHTVITYDYDIPNTKYFEQLKSYQTRLKKYESDMPKWEKADAQWVKKKTFYDIAMIKVREEVKRAFEENVSLLDDDAQNVI